MPPNFEPDILEQYEELHAQIVESSETIEHYARENSYFKFENLAETIETEYETIENGQSETIVEFLEETEIIEPLDTGEDTYREYSGVQFKYTRFESILDQLEESL